MKILCFTKNDLKKSEGYLEIKKVFITNHYVALFDQCIQKGIKLTKKASPSCMDS